MKRTSLRAVRRQKDVIFVRTQLPDDRAVDTAIDGCQHMTDNVKFQPMQLALPPFRNEGEFEQRYILFRKQSIRKPEYKLRLIKLLMTNLKAKSQLYPQLLDVLKSVKDTNLKTSQKYVHSPFYGKIKGGILQLRCHNV